MRLRLKALLCATSAAGVVGFAGVAEAADAAADAVASVEELVVTGEPLARANNVVGEQRIESLAGGQNIVDAVRFVPGVQIRGADAFNGDPWSYGINIRGFEVNLRSSKIGQTLDGLPLFNASYYLGGAPAAKYLLTENAQRVQVNQGTADVGSPSTSALGGTLAYFSRDPAQEFGGKISATLASYTSRRFYANLDTGVIFGNTRAYVSVSDLDTHLWPHGGSTPAGLEQFHVEAKSVTELGALTITARVSHNESDDDPVIEATRAFIEQTGYRVDGSASVFNTASATPNEFWADEWAAIRDNTFGYLKFDWRVSDSLRLTLAPYGHRNEGVGEFLPPFQEPRLVGTTPGALTQVILGGSRIRTTQADAQGRAVLPFAAGGVERIYTNLQGQQVRSSACFNPDNTARAGADCSSAQSYRNSTYYHRRTGIVASGEYEWGGHQIRAGVWYEHLDRDFGRKWYPYLDIRRGPIASDITYREDFRQNFKTDSFKFHIADTWQVTDQLTIDLGVQHYLVDVEGTSVEDRNFNAVGQQISTTASAFESDSNEFLPSVGVVFEATDQIQVFAGYSKNFAAIGDWAVEKTGTDFTNLKPEVATNIEAGVRFTGDRIRAAASVYRIKYDDAIVFLTNDFAVGTGGINYSAGTGGTYFNIDGGVESMGFEGSVDVRLTDELSAYGAVTVTDAKYTSGFRAASYSGNPLIVAKDAKVSGTPEYILAGVLNYQREDFSAQLSVRRVGEAPGDAANTSGLALPAYTLVDLSVGYRISLGEEGRYAEGRLVVNNLLEEEYIGGVLDEFTQRYNVGAPRTVAFTLTMAF